MTARRRVGTHRLAVAGMVMTLASGIMGCDDEEAVPGATSGTSGTTSGTSGTAGSNSGTSGASGNSGTSGASGSGGTAGAAGTTAGSSGAAGTTAGSGGSAGAAGSGGTAGTAGTAGTTLTAEPVANDAAKFVQPFDASPNPDGTKVFFTALDPTTGEGGVFQSTAMTGGTVARVDTGTLKLAAPVGIATSGDGATLYVADLGAVGTGSVDSGGIFSLASSGGALALVNGGGGISPRGLTIFDAAGTETLAFTGTNKTTHLTGVYTLPAAGGTVTTLSEGTIFSDPSGIVAAASGTYYVLDSSPGTSTAAIIKVEGGTPTVFASGLRVGFPAGLTLSKDAATLFVSGADAAGKSVVFEISVADHSSVTFSTGLTGTEPAGLHRATSSDVFAFVDSTAGTTGTVFVLSYQP